MSFFGCFGGSKLLKSPKRIWKKESPSNTRADRFKTALELITILKSLCLVLGVDFKFTLLAAHPSFDENMMSKNISKKAIKRLTSLMHTLQEIKIQRMHKLQELARNLIALWNSLGTSAEGQQSFHIVARHVASSEHEIAEPYILSLDFLNNVEAEVSRLEELKSTKKKLVSRKKKELKVLQKCSHFLVNTNAEIEESGTAGCSNSVNVRSECGKLEQEIPLTMPNSNNTSWVFVWEKETEQKRISLAPSNSNNDNWRLEEEENDNPFRDYF